MHFFFLFSKLKYIYLLYFKKVILSSSYSGYGLVSLHQDVEELDLLIDYLELNLHVKRIVLCGHSTGCQDIIFFLKYAKNKTKIWKGILQGPASDRESYTLLAKDIKPDFEKALECVNSGNGNQIFDIPYALPHPLRAFRFVSLAGRMTEDDMFSSDLTDLELQTQLGHVEVPLLLVFSLEDEYVPPTVDIPALSQRISKQLKQSQVLLLKAANHSISQEEPQRIFISSILEFIKD